MVGYSQSNENKNRDFQISFKSKSGKEISIDVIDNTKWTISTAIILIGDKGKIEIQLNACEKWTAHNNRTYILDVAFINKELIQETVDQILNSQKLIDSHLFLIQFGDEFEGIKTKPGNNFGGQIIQLKNNNLCETIEKINWR